MAVGRETAPSETLPEVMLLLRSSSVAKWQAGVGGDGDCGDVHQCCRPSRTTTSAMRCSEADGPTKRNEDESELVDVWRVERTKTSAREVLRLGLGSVLMRVRRMKWKR